ncbi:metal ABC transporter solute-binding protein, Zn/Mn family [Methanolobus halotolerans]|uniref:Zinc ABC transporter substrate-binding protein n=1 Tax=Methanolobus halotolerans TaxID=2052935 RepID=A0A4E0R189_9EURY|nr:zinc ABC transporter substrate-binding protein [Methanolobus halotolerans]TGC10919.1 zinc ABC transporter substrate-binding protein [Methanolobus halotolerans]
MIRRKLVFVIFVSMCLAFVSGCVDGPDVSASSADKPVVVVSILPEAEFVEQIAGDQAKVIVMVPSGADPHSYEVTPGQLRELSDADMYVKVGSGLSFENVWMDRLIAVNPDMHIVDASNGIQLRTMESHSHEEAEEEHEDESEGEHVEGDHTEEASGSRDPHIWTSPKNAQMMVENIYEGMVEIDPENGDMYAQNRDAYIAELEAADADVRKALEGKEGSSFLVYHPSWGYFADDYGLEQISVEVEGKEPSVQDMRNLIDIAREEDIKVIFVQSGFSTSSAQTIADAIDGEVVEVDPLAKDYIDNLAKVTAAFEKGLA